MTKVLYISSYQFSGTTLASFLLNNHTRITTVGHTMGWAFADDEMFYCSCGKEIESCPFYARIKEAYAANNLAFDIRNFGTAYRLASNDRLNRMLTGAIPGLQNTKLELFRDVVLRTLPYLSSRISHVDDANRVFMRTALELSDADVFLDNSHDPFRFRHLARIKEFDMHHLHLIRDPRGVALSCRRHLKWPISVAMKLWMRRQNDIFRIARECSNSIQIYYENLCIDTNTTLQHLQESLGLAYEPFTGDLGEKEHHILGNDMRLKAGDIKFDERWKRELARDELRTLHDMADHYVSSTGNDKLSHVLTHYFQAK